MSTDRSFSKDISAHRTLLGLSLQDVANRAGITKSHLWDLEQGRSSNPTIKTIAGIAEALTVPAIRLAEGALNDLRRAALTPEQTNGG